jgi:hypothetical protein
VFAMGINVYRNGAHNIERVFIVHSVASRTDRTIFGIAVVGQAINDSCATGFAMFDWEVRVHLCSVRKKTGSRRSLF